MPFFLKYRRDCQLPTGLDFYEPPVTLATVTMVYAKELFVQLKTARQLA